jgi:hypothetical protein
MKLDINQKVFGQICALEFRTNFPHTAGKYVSYNFGLAQKAMRTNIYKLLYRYLTILFFACKLLPKLIHQIDPT